MGPPLFSVVNRWPPRNVQYLALRGYEFDLERDNDEYFTRTLRRFDAVPVCICREDDVHVFDTVHDHDRQSCDLLSQDLTYACGFDDVDYVIIKTSGSAHIPEIVRMLEFSDMFSAEVIELKHAFYGNICVISYQMMSSS